AVTDTAPVRLAVGGTSAGGLGGIAAARSTFTEAGQRFEVAVPLEPVSGAAVVLPWSILAAGLVLAALAGALGVNAARRAKATPVPKEGVLYGVGRDVTERRQAESELRRLAREQAARRRVATLVATGESPAEVFSAVAEEVERLLDAQATAIGRLEPDGEMAI